MEMYDSVQKENSISSITTKNRRDKRVNTVTSSRLIKVSRKVVKVKCLRSKRESNV